VVDLLKGQISKSITQRAIELNTEVPVKNLHTEFLCGLILGAVKKMGRIAAKIDRGSGLSFNLQFSNSTFFHKLKAHLSLFLKIIPHYFEG